MVSRNIVVIGGSAGALQALIAVMRRLPGDLGAAILVVIHMPSASPGMLDQILDRHASLSRRIAARTRDAGLGSMAEENEAKAVQAEERADVLRQLLLRRWPALESSGERRKGSRRR